MGDVGWGERGGAVGKEEKKASYLPMYRYGVHAVVVGKKKKNWEKKEDDE
jgi:hypothetical protein